MKALVKSQKAKGLWIEDVPKPEIGPNDLLIKVGKTAICGTDLHIYQWDEWAQKTLPVPIIVGHEFMGTIEAVGSHVTGFKEGQRVSGEGHITCGHCRNCRAGRRHLCRNTKGIGVHQDGCFAEYVSLPATNAFHVPDEISDDVASIFDPLGNAVHTSLSFDLVGEDVLITGAGPIGMMAAGICRRIGARHVVVTDVNDHRLKIAHQMGASSVVNPNKTSLKTVMEDLNIVEGFDVGLEMSGNASAFSSMLEVMNNGGRVAILGIFPKPVAIDWSQVIFKGLHLKGIYGREMFETWYKMGMLLRGGLDVTPVITHRFPPEKFEEAFQILQSGASGKIIFEWS